MKKLYLMRHGQTLFNKRRKIQGACDSPLTEEGIKQALLAKKYFEDNNIYFDHAYSSTQERASDTLELITDMSYERIKGIKEWNFGLFEGESEDLNPPRFRADQRSYEDFFVAFQGESDQDVRKRMVTSLSEIMEKPDHKRVLAVSHGGAAYQFVQTWADWEIVKGLKFSNCCILEFEYLDGKFNFIKMINP